MGSFHQSRGKAGHNICAYLHMEHLNRHIKDSFRHLGANKTPQAVKRAGKVVGVPSKPCTTLTRSQGFTYLEIMPVTQRPVTCPK